jgi:hypothetical protein
VCAFSLSLSANDNIAIVEEENKHLYLYLYLYFLRPVVFQAGLQPDWVIFAVWAREAFSIAAEVSFSADIFYI